MNCCLSCVVSFLAQALVRGRAQRKGYYIPRSIHSQWTEVCVNTRKTSQCVQHCPVAVGTCLRVRRRPSRVCPAERASVGSTTHLRCPWIVRRGTNAVLGFPMSTLVQGHTTNAGFLFREVHSTSVSFYRRNALHSRVWAPTIHSGMFSKVWTAWATLHVRCPRTEC